MKKIIIIAVSLLALCSCNSNIKITEGDKQGCRKGELVLTKASNGMIRIDALFEGSHISTNEYYTLIDLEDFRCHVYSATIAYKHGREYNGVVSIKETNYGYRCTTILDKSNPCKHSARDFILFNIDPKDLDRLLEKIDDLCSCEITDLKTITKSDMDATAKDFESRIAIIKSQIDTSASDVVNDIYKMDEDKDED